MNRDKIIQKLNGIRAKAFDKSIANTPEAINAINKFNELMAEYNLTLTDLEVKESKVFLGRATTTKTTDFMHYMVIHIADVTSTEVLRASKDDYIFLGMEVDVLYANWLFSMISNSLENSSIAYKIGADYHHRINNGEKGVKVMEAFKHGFLFAITDNLEKLREVNTGNALVPVKNELIATFMKDKGIEGPATKTTAVAIPNDYVGAAQEGMKAGDKVKLRKALD